MLSPTHKSDAQFYALIILILPVFSAMQGDAAAVAAGTACGSKVALIHMGRHALSGHPIKATLTAPRGRETAVGTSVVGRGLKQDLQRTWANIITASPKSAAIEAGDKGEESEEDGFVALELYQVRPIPTPTPPITSRVFLLTQFYHSIHALTLPHFRQSPSRTCAGSVSFPQDRR